MKTLIAVESPHKAKVIQGFLGSNFIVLATVGHFKEMPIPKNMTPEQKKKYGDFAMDISNNFEPLWKTAPGKQKTITAFKAALKKVDQVVIGTDSDNEGALIGLLLVEELKTKLPMYRATWNEITKTAVLEGLKNKKLIDPGKQEPKDFYNAAASALARGSWDRLYGFSTSPYLWTVLKSGLSSGRVQLPGTRLVVERELKRLAHKSVSYYSITGLFDNTEAKLIEVDGKKIATAANIDDEGNVAKGYTLITDENVDSTIFFLNKQEYTVGDVKSKPYRRSSPPPFTTSTALQSIGNKTGMSSKQITSILQALYTDGHCTYIRTVSVVAAPEAIAASRKTIEKTYGKKFLPSSPRVFKDKKAENSGHECIRAVVNGSELASVKLTDSKAQKVFDAVRNRMLASQAIDQEGTTWTAMFVSTDKKAVFSASETEIHEPGWTVIYNDNLGDNS
jgi:DNA topoisomerase-1